MHLCVYDLKTIEKTLNLAQAANTYDAATAIGDVLITGCTIYCTVSGTLFTSVSIQTNAGVPLVLMTAAEGALVNIILGSHPVAACQLWVAPWTLRSGQKIQFTMIGATGLGELRLIVLYRPISVGGVLV